MLSNKASPTSNTYFSQRLKLHYLDWGNHGAPHLLLIHGSQDNCHNWDWTAEQFCDDYHVIAQDLRGHGDSAWVKGSPYQQLDYVYDIAQLVQQQNLDPVNIIGHSLGGSIACLYSGIYPEKVNSLISIEGVGAAWYIRGEEDPQTRLRNWVDNTRLLSARSPRKYETQADAYERMKKSNPHLSEERARHLSIHGSNQNEDGTFSWKFDNYTHSGPHLGMNLDDLTQLWGKIDCPTLLMNALQGFGHRTGQNDTLQHFRQGEVLNVDNAGHWLHHDQFETFIAASREFLSRANT